jgi:hypothetical protein
VGQFRGAESRSVGWTAFVIDVPPGGTFPFFLAIRVYLSPTRKKPPTTGGHARTDEPPTIEIDSRDCAHSRRKPVSEARTDCAGETEKRDRYSKGGPIRFRIPKGKNPNGS